MTSSRKSGLVRLLLLVVLGAAPALWDQTTDCTSCHEQGQKVAKSAHAAVACATCHVKHENFPHPEGVPKPACTGCHTTQATDYEKGVHGQAVLTFAGDAQHTANYLPAALADPKQTEWKLVFRDVHDVIYMRNPPPDVANYHDDHARLLVRYMFLMTPDEQRRLLSASTSAAPPAQPAAPPQKVGRADARGRDRPSHHRR